MTAGARTAHDEDPSLPKQSGFICSTQTDHTIASRVGKHIGSRNWPPELHGGRCSQVMQVPAASKVIALRDSLQYRGFVSSIPRNDSKLLFATIYHTCGAQHGSITSQDRFTRVWCSLLSTETILELVLSPKTCCGMLCNSYALRACGDDNTNSVAGSLVAEKHHTL